MQGFAVADTERPSLVLKQLLDQEADVLNDLTVCQGALAVLASGDCDVYVTINRGDFTLNLLAADVIEAVRAQASRARDRAAIIGKRIEAAIEAIRSQE